MEKLMKKIDSLEPEERKKLKQLLKEKGWVSSGVNAVSVWRLRYTIICRRLTGLACCLLSMYLTSSIFLRSLWLCTLFRQCFFGLWKNPLTNTKKLSRAEQHVWSVHVAGMMKSPRLDGCTRKRNPSWMSIFWADESTNILIKTWARKLIQVWHLRVAAIKTLKRQTGLASLWQGMIDSISVLSPHKKKKKYVPGKNTSLCVEYADTNFFLCSCTWRFVWRCHCTQHGLGYAVQDARGPSVRNSVHILFGTWEKNKKHLPVCEVEMFLCLNACHSVYRKKEEESKRKLLENPIRMRQIQKMVSGRYSQCWQLVSFAATWTGM